MFGFVWADLKELSPEDRARYQQVYCGICRQIRLRCSSSCRLSLSYDMAFLALLLMSLYEPEEETGPRSCGFHPVKPRPWTDNEFIRYAADMNIALAYYNALDDTQDDGSLLAKGAVRLLKGHLPAIEARWPRQCQAIKTCIQDLAALEAAECDQPDLPAGCFGTLMGALFQYRQDHWSAALDEMGQALGRFIYLADAAVDYRKDLKKGRYNPFAAMGTGEDWPRWEEYLVLEMGRCAQLYELLPLVQDKSLMDNIIYSGVWLTYRTRQKERSNGRSL